MISHDEASDFAVHKSAMALPSERVGLSGPERVSAPSPVSINCQLLYGVSAPGVSLPEVTLLLGVSADPVTFELVSGASVLVEVETLTLVGAGGEHPKVSVTTNAAAATRKNWATVFTGRNLRNGVGM